MQLYDGDGWMVLTIAVKGRSKKSVSGAVILPGRTSQARNQRSPNCKDKCSLSACLHTFTFSTFKRVVSFNKVEKVGIKVSKVISI